MMAEMKWLAADFLEERKRFTKKRKEINKAIRYFDIFRIALFGLFQNTPYTSL